MGDDGLGRFETGDERPINWALERARQVADGAPLAGGQRKLLDYIISECDSQIDQVDSRLGSSTTLRNFRDFLGNLSTFIGEA